MEFRECKTRRPIDFRLDAARLGRITELLKAAKEQRERYTL